MEKRESELVCNCEDEYRTSLCPVHDKDRSISHAVIITDEMLHKDELRQWIGLTYQCPKCKKYSIMDFMNYCGNCGAEVKLHSRRLTNLINANSAGGR